MNLIRANKRKEILRNIEKAIDIAGGKLYIYGCSKTAEMITDFIEKNGGPAIEAYAVDDLYYSVDSFLGKQVLKRSLLVQRLKEEDYVICGFTGSLRAKALKKELPPANFVYFYFPYSANVNGRYLTYDFYVEHKKNFDRAYDLLSDEYSKKTMKAFMNACISGDVKEIDELCVDGQYFNDLTKGCKKGCFIDCGAYIGDTIEEAAAFLGDQLVKVIAFEPDDRNLQALKLKMKECGINEGRLSLIPKGSYSEKAVLHFSSSDSSSSISEDGDVDILVDSVDGVVNEYDVVSFIKMDVEGSEKESLLGAVKTIQKDHPILSVCVYHKPEDLFELTELIRELVKDVEYRFYLRYHGPDLRELVFYAIPV